MCVLNGPSRANGRSIFKDLLVAFSTTNTNKTVAVFAFVSTSHETRIETIWTIVTETFESCIKT